MFKLVATSLLALLAASSATARVVPRKDAPSGYDTADLECYETYHIRYIALDCVGQHDSSFFNDCCHPLLKTESLSDRDAQCTPSSSALAAATKSEGSAADSCNADSSDSSPAPSSSAKPAATPVANVEAAPSPSPSKAPSSSSDSGDFVTGGFGTFFYQNGNAGACGTVHADSDFVLAIDANRYGPTGVQSPLCGKQVFIINTDNGKSVTATIADACPTCDNDNSIDMSVGAFTQIAAESTGLIPIKWKFV